MPFDQRAFVGQLPDREFPPAIPMRTIPANRDSPPAIVTSIDLRAPARESASSCQNPIKRNELIEVISQNM